MGHETRILTLREEHIFEVFQKRVLRRILGPKGDEVAGGRRKLNNEEHYNLYSSPNFITIVKSIRIRLAVM
jgi:hypothetical protein